MLVPLAIAAACMAGCATHERAMPDLTAVYDISTVDVPPRAKVQARPRYPFELRKAGVGGFGVIDFVVGTDGVVREARVLRASDARFGDAALEAVCRWRFVPASIRGYPVMCHVQVPINFSMDPN